jgi:hypothetical protein
LIAARRQSYEALAHCTIPVAELPAMSLDPTRDAEAFLEKIRIKLAR